MKSKLLLLTAFFAVVIGLAVFASESRSAPDTSAGTRAPGKTLYTCGMHPWIIQDHPGNCPICGMKLAPIKTNKMSGTNETDATATAAPRKILYYKSTMMAGETSPNPGKDSMGMDMVPVYGNAQTETKEPDGTDEGSSAIAIDPATIQLMNIQTTEVVRGPLRRTIRTVGTIDYNETALTDVTTKFKGWIEKLDVDATGDLVHRGEPLFEIYSPDLYSAEAEYAAVLDSSNSPDFASLRDAAADKLKFFDISDGQIAALAKSRAPQKTMEILAPADGFVTEKNVVQGQMVDAGATLYRLADLGLIWVYAQVYEQDLPYVQLGQEATVKLSSLPDREFRGRVTYIYPDVNEKTRTAKVRLEFENPGYFLKPGMFVSAQLISELTPSALLVPDSAVLRSGEKNTVFVALAGGKFDARTVELGPEAENDMDEVNGGLREGERVVTSGQFMLDSESQLREAIQKMSDSTRAVPSAVPAASGTTTTGTATDARREAAPTGRQDGCPTGETDVVYVCPMPEHVSIVYDHPGKCPICGMTLVPVTRSELREIQPGGKVLYYTCPMPEHSFIHEDKPGKCPLCGMTLIPVMASPASATNEATSSPAPPTAEPAAKQIYTCPMHPDVISDKPGKCPKCGMTLVPLGSAGEGDSTK